MHRILRVTIVLCFIAHVLAHPHHDTLTEEQASAPIDNILWIHMFLQATVWGVMFPVGWCLGLQGVNGMCPTGNWLCAHSGRLHSRSLTQGTILPPWYSWNICQHSHHSHPRSTCRRHLSEAAHP
ncbi:hypothetical protein BDZ97DRAFT_141536 [Flammula alnicola]|nr:hypothetical protein BDZ97DRAFT_141536 [Flammula alnicola]